MEMPKIIKGIALILFIILAGSMLGFFISGEKIQLSYTEESAGTDNANTEDIEEITLRMGATGYDPGTITVPAGTTVRITADLNSVNGCFRSFVIEGLGITKTFKTGDTVLEFTPTEKGTYTYRCSMGMARGKLIIT